MNLQQAQLGNERGIQLGGHVPAASPRQGLLQQALAAIVSGAGGAVASNAVNGLMTPDVGAQAVQQGTQLPGIVQTGTNADGSPVLEDKANALQRWLMPRSQEMLSNAKSANAAQALQGAQTNRINTMTPLEARQQAEVTKSEELFRDPKIANMAANTYSMNTNAGDVVATQPSRIAENYSRTGVNDATAVNLGARTETENALRPGLTAQQKAQLLESDAKVGNLIALTRGQEIGNYQTGGNVPQREAMTWLAKNVPQDKIHGAIADEASKLGYDPVGKPMMNDPIMRQATANVLQRQKDALGGKTGTDAASPAGFQGLRKAVPAVVQGANSALSNVSDFVITRPAWLMDGQEGVDAALASQRKTFPQTQEEKLAKQAALQKWIEDMQGRNIITGNK